MLGQATPSQERIAEFDQDGTLWVEHPVYAQVVFCLDHVPELIKAKPELKDHEPFKTVLSGDREAIAKLSLREFFEIVVGTQSGMDVEAFREISRKWLVEARHPRWDRLYTELVYQPMIEVLQYLRANGYRTFIATRGSAGFANMPRRFTASCPSRSPEPSRRSNTVTTRTVGPS